MMGEYLQHLGEGHEDGVPVLADLLAAPQQQLAEPVHGVVAAVVLGVAAHVAQHRADVRQQRGQHPAQRLYTAT